MSIVFGLPSDLSSIILSSWVNLADWGHLDSAVCNKRHRIDYINLIAAEDIRFKGFKGRVGNGFLVWLKLRGILIDFVSLDGNNITSYELLQSRNYLRKQLSAFKISTFGQDVADILGKFTFKFRSLTQLYLQRSATLSDSMVSGVSLNCSNLSLLDITKCTSITSVSIQYIAARCSSLETFTLAGCTGISELPHVATEAGQLPPLPVKFDHNLSKLTTLTVTDCPNLRDSSFTFIVANTKALTSVNTSGCNALTDDTLNCLVSLCASSLKHFNAQRCHLFNDVTMANLASHCTYLVSINLRNSRAASNAVMQAILDNCKKVEEICIDGEFLHWRVSADMVLALIKQYGAQLTRLCVSSEGIKDEHLVAIGTLCVNLKHFMLIRESGPVGFTDEGVAALTKGGRLLETFVLEKNPFQGITDVSVEAVAHHCPRLKVFKIVGATQVASLCPLVKHCPLLQSVHLFDSVELNAETVAALLNTCYGLTSLSLPLEALTDVTLTAILDRKFSALIELNLKKCLAKYAVVTTGVLTRAEKFQAKGLTLKFLPPKSF